MKPIKARIFLLLAAFTIVINTGSTQNVVADSTGLLGDDFSLQGALQLFKTSDDLESFEKALNKENNYVNNLDLNEDGDIDYIRVVDQMEGDVHVIVLRVPISKEESQDIAVIHIERTGESNAVLQIVGDEVLYGPDYLVEPIDEEVDAEGKGGPHPVYETTRVVVNVWFWPSVRYIYTPGYSVYVSPWGWAYYPVWWRPWRPHPWRYYHTRRVHYHVGFGFTTTHRVVRAPRVYTPVRKTSVTVRTKSAKRVSVRNTASLRTAGTNKTAVKKTTSVAGVNKTEQGVVAGKKTTTAGVKRSGDGVTASKKTTAKGVKKTEDGVVAGKKSKSTKVEKNKKGDVKATKKKSKTKVKKNNKKTTKKKTTKKKTVRKKKGG